VAQAVVEIRDLAVRYGGAEVANIPALQVWQNEILAVMGPNGAGKSTLLRVLGFLERPTLGHVVFQGEPVAFGARELLPLHRRTAVVFQEPLLLDTTVYENVALGLRLRGVRQRGAKVRRWLERFGVAHLADRPARGLSGGEAQRTSLARAFVLSPELLLLDEPFSALDPPTKDALLADLKLVLEETQTTTVFVTHDRDEALMLGDRVAVMMAGRIAQLDAPERIFTSPSNEAIARFVGVETILRGRVASTGGGLVTVAVNGQTVSVVGDAAPNERVLVCVRPEDVVLTSEPMQPASVANRLHGRVSRVVPLGPASRVVVDCGEPVVALTTRQALEDLRLDVSQPIVASFEATAAHLIRRSR